MAFSDDIALTIDPVSPQSDHLAGHRHICVRQSNSIEFHSQVSLAKEVTRLTIGLQMPLQIAAARKRNAAKLLHAAQMAEHRIADVGGSRGEVWFVDGAMQQRSCRYEDFLGPDINSKREEQQREKRAYDHATHG